MIKQELLKLREYTSIETHVYAKRLYTRLLDGSITCEDVAARFRDFPFRDEFPHLMALLDNPETAFFGYSMYTSF